MRRLLALALAGMAMPMLAAAQTVPTIARSATNANGNPVSSNADVAAAIGTKADVASPVITGTARLSVVQLSSALASALTVQGGGVFGATAFQQVSILPGLATGSSESININRVGSNANDSDVFRSFWIVQHTGANAHPQFNGYISTSIPNGLSPGDTWNFLAQIGTSGTTDTSAVHLAAYSQAVRDNAPGGKVGVPLEAQVAEVRSKTGQSSATDGVLRTMELDMFAAGADDYVGSVGIGREVMPIVLGKNQASDASPTIGSLIGVYPVVGDNVSLKSGIAFANQLNVTGSLWNSTQAVQASGAHMIWMRDGHHIALDTAGTRTLSYDSGTGKLFYAVSGVNKFSIDASGNVRAAGTVTASVTP